MFRKTLFLSLVVYSISISVILISNWSRAPIQTVGSTDTPTPSSTQTQKIELQRFKPSVVNSSGRYKYLIVVNEKINDIESDEVLYMVDSYPQPTLKVEIARIGLPGMFGLGEILSVQDGYYVMNVGIDTMIFSAEGEVITRSVQRQSNFKYLIDVKETRVFENPITVLIGNQGVGDLGTAKLDVRTGKIVAIEITKK